MGFKVAKAVHKALEPIKGRTLIFQTREQLADTLCGSSNSSGGGRDLWLNIVGYLDDEGILAIEDITFEGGRKVTQIKVTVHEKGLRLSREGLRYLNGLRKRHVEVNKRPAYVRRPMGVAA